ncbi:hypothetical protein N803_13920 [Knoellia subterranea KCTC 19937]|uniref:Uncharacterized protein n=1 Tax=Knoellia subterranea KCTC 19937 TaxID=1385521 RepID=A0A0A0JKH5_9MICO|nr:hypothetical protein N803_13920 [Knoellia subterranea KCTC 19937]
MALTPGILLSFFSMRAAHDAQVIPPMASSTSWSCCWTLSTWVAIVRSFRVWLLRF